MIRIVIGSEEKTQIPCKVLQHSILKHASIPSDKIQFFPSNEKSWANLKERKHGEGTGFSFVRWNIPKYFGYSGYAIYLDADQLVFGDIVNLWGYTSCLTEKNKLACTYQHDKFFKGRKVPNTSVSVINCSGVKDIGWLDGEEIYDYLKNDKKRKRYATLMAAMHLKQPPLRLPTVWNVLNQHLPGTQLLHYTREPLQPWYSPKHPCADLWGNALFLAMQEGIVTKSEVKHATENYVPHTACCRGTGMNPDWLNWLTHAGIAF